MKQKTIITLIVVPASVLLALTYLQLPGKTLFWSALQNSGHSIVFAGLVMIFLLLVRLETDRLQIQSVVLIVVGLALLGVLIEVAQELTGRGGSTSDMVSNMVGILGGAFLFWSLNRVMTSSRPKNTQNTVLTCVLATIGLLIMAWGIRLPAVYFVTNMQRSSLPILADFENPGAEYYVDGNGSIQHVGRHEQWTGNNSHSVKVRYLPGKWPNIAFREPEQDWSQYSRITFKVFNPSNRPMPLSVRIDDSSLGLLDEDHMTLRHIAPHGVSEVNLAFENFIADAKKRGRPGHPTFKKIQGFMVYLSNVSGEQVLYFDEFILR